MPHQKGRPSWRQITVQVHEQRPGRLDDLEMMRDDLRAQGDYARAKEVQQEIENLKSSEDSRRFEALAQKHIDEMANLEAEQAKEYGWFVAKWDRHMMELQTHSDTSLRMLEDRHVAEQDLFQQQANASQIKYKWSSELLNLRRIEEHLLRQREFGKAHKVKSQADRLEALEVASQQQAFAAKMALEEQRLNERQARELAALKKKLSTQQREALTQQEKELDKLMKKFQAAKLALQRDHGYERVNMEHALKGWFNPRKFGLPVPPLTPTSPPSLLNSPGLKLAASRSTESLYDSGMRPKRPATAPAPYMGAPGSPGAPGGPLGTPQSAYSVGEDYSRVEIPVNEWPDSPIDGQLQPRKPWGSETTGSQPTTPTPQPLHPPPFFTHTSTTTSSSSPTGTPGSRRNQQPVPHPQAQGQQRPRTSSSGRVRPSASATAAPYLSSSALRTHTRNISSPSKQSILAGSSAPGSSSQLQSNKTYVASTLRPPSRGPVVMKIHE